MKKILTHLLLFALAVTSVAACREASELPEPTYLHHPLVTHDDGRRLAKRDQAPTLAAMRDARVDGAALAEQLTMGILPTGYRLALP